MRRPFGTTGLAAAVVVGGLVAALALLGFSGFPGSGTDAIHAPHASVLSVSQAAVRSGPSSSTGRTVPLKVIHDDGEVLALVPVTVRGHGPYTFVLDTGASNSVIDRSVASATHLPPTGTREPIIGVVGQTKVPLVRIGQGDWKAGGVPLPATRAAVVDLGALHGPGMSIGGLLGSDVLSTFGHITIDYRAQTLRLPAT